MSNYTQKDNFLEIMESIKENQVYNVEINLPDLSLPSSTLDSINHLKEAMDNLHTNLNYSLTCMTKTYFHNNLVSPLTNLSKICIKNINTSFLEATSAYLLNYQLTISDTIESIKKSILFNITPVVEYIRASFPFNNLEDAFSCIELWSKYGWVISDFGNLNFNIFSKKPKNQDDADKIILDCLTPNFIDEVLSELFNFLDEKEEAYTFSILEEAIFCFKNEKYMACVSTLLPLFDAELINVQIKKDNNCNKKIGNGGVQKIEKYLLNKSVPVINYFLQISVYHYLKELYKKTDNFNTNQYNINRNMILHGVSNRMYTELDCIKLFNAYTVYRLVTSSFDNLDTETA